MLGEYDNGSAQGKGASEYLWLPTEDGGAIPVGLHRRGRLYAIHPDHLGTPRLMTDESNEVVWQWPYSAFGDNSPTGILQATNQTPVRLKATEPTELNLRMPGQYFDEETGTFQNYFREYDPAVGRYRQADPIGLAGGLNGYVYANQNPLTFIDPEGLQVAIPAPMLAPAAGSLARPTAGTLIDPMVTPGAPDPNDPNNHQRCKSLKKRIDNLRDEIYNKRYPDLMANPGNLPQRIGPGEVLRDTIRGHEKL
jgi:RHS repeat-associated protein